MTKYIFPACFALNSFSLQLLVVVAGLSGHHALAADLSLAQAAMILLFYSFSGNARNLILKSGSAGLESSIIQLRTLSAPILAATALLVAVQVSGAGFWISLAIVLRQLSEWFSEIELSRLERSGAHGRAKIFAAALGFPLVAASGALLFSIPLFLASLYVWAVVPLLLCSDVIRKGTSSLSKITIEWRRLLPNCASTLIIGAVVFFSRVLIVAFTGKQIAGQLFTAFALGGVVGALYERTIGPSLKVSSGLSGVRSVIFNAARALPVAGAVLVCVPLLFSDAIHWLAQNAYLAGAAGFSLAGGYVMLGAQILKINLLHSPERDNVFVADLISNFAILIAVPVIFLVSGEAGLMTLYFLNAFLVYLAYWLVGGGGVIASAAGRERILQALAAFVVVVPIFFQLGGGVYRGNVELYDWGGRLSMLPLPLSMLVCLPLILVANSLRETKTFAVFAFAVFSFMLCGTLISSTGDQLVVKDKLLLSLQYLFPFFGLVMAEHLAGRDGFLRRTGRVFVAVVLGVALLQLAVSLGSGSLRLKSYLYLFSIYNNSQYAAVILLAAYLTGLFAVYDGASPRERKLLLFGTVLMCLYSVLSWSMLAIGLFWGGILLFWGLSSRRKEIVGALIGSGLVCLLAWGVLKYYDADFALMKQGSRPTFAALDERKNRIASGCSAPISITATPDFAPGVGEAFPHNVSERFRIWNFYLKGLHNADAKTMVFGHPVIPDRKAYPSAHNYYLDLAYNFGLLVLAPFLWLIFYTARLVWLRRREIIKSRPLAGLTFTVFFLLLVDNSLKVGLRQPYPGIFTFFLWGALLAELRNHPEKSEAPPRLH